MTVTTTKDAASLETISTAVIMEAGVDSRLKLAAYLSLVGAALWGFLLFRWFTFAPFAWTPLPLELSLDTLPPLVPYLTFGAMIAVNLAGVHW